MEFLATGDTTNGFDFWPALGLAVLGSGVTLAIAAASYFWWRPMLSVVRRDDQYGRLQTIKRTFNVVTMPVQMNPVRMGQVTQIKEDNVVYVRLTVENTGRTTALRCRGFLVGIEKKVNDTFQQQFFDSKPLTWSYDSPQAIDIPPGPRFNLDLFSTQEGDTCSIQVSARCRITTRRRTLASFACPSWSLPRMLPHRTFNSSFVGRAIGRTLIWSESRCRIFGCDERNRKRMAGLTTSTTRRTPDASHRGSPAR